MVRTSVDALHRRTSRCAARKLVSPQNKLREPCQRSSTPRRPPPPGGSYIPRCVRPPLCSPTTLSDMLWAKHHILYCAVVPALRSVSQVSCEYTSAFVCLSRDRYAYKHTSTCIHRVHVYVEIWAYRCIAISRFTWYTYTCRHIPMHNYASI